jgi:nucleoid-associated protein YgaU
MKYFIPLLAATALLCALPVQAQDPATEERLEKLTAQIQDLVDGQAALGKRISKLAEELQRLNDKFNSANSAAASTEDLRRLAEKVQEVDRKRESDKDAIVSKLEALARLERTPVRPPPRAPEAEPPPAPKRDEKGYEYTVQAGDSLSLIVEAYKQQGVKTSTSEILKANPGLNANRLRPNQKIFIPAPKP